MMFKEECMTLVSSKEFGLCDYEKTPPAYVDLDNKDAWIARVINPSEHEIEFYALDQCADIRDANNNLVSVCDAVLHTKRILYFVELKDRKSKGWRGNAIQQLKSTLKIYFLTKNSQLDKKNIKCYASNKQKPAAPNSNLGPIIAFKKETGCMLYQTAVILIES